MYGLTHIESFMMWHATPRDDDEESEVIAQFDNLRQGLAGQGIVAGAQTPQLSTRDLLLHVRQSGSTFSSACNITLCVCVCVCV